MRKIHALLVGINAYPPGTAPPLTGCVNDIAAAERLLRDRTRGEAVVHTLRDAEATTAAVEEAVRRRLGGAGPGDTVLFWFSGHGTHTRATGDDLLIEATGRNQAIVCADGPLPDKRLGALLDSLASGGAHVAAVLDCCFAGGATRDTPAADTGTARFVAPRAEWGPGASAGAGEALGGSRDAWVEPVVAGGRHVLLAASRLDQVSYEDHYDGQRHGTFTHALLGAVRDAGPEVTYRELLSAADARVQRSRRGQQPVLYPDAPGGVADLPFLGGTVGLGPSPYLLRHGVDGWEVNCGASHGLREGAGARHTEFTVLPTGAPVLFGDVEQDPQEAPSRRVVAARTVEVARTLVTPVEPVGWSPDPSRVHPVTLSALALPPATVSVERIGSGGRTDIGAGVEGGGPGSYAVSPLRRVADPAAGGDLHFRVAVGDGSAHVLRRDGTPFVEPLTLAEAIDPRTGVGTDTDLDRRRLVTCLSHLTRWHRIRDLSARPSPLDGLVRVEVRALGGAGDSAPLVPDGRGEISCAYTRGPDGPEPPLLSIRLHNRAPDRPLWCLLLALTDSYESHALLYPGHFIAPGGYGHALDGDPVRFALPASRPAVPGAEARDWLKLIVAEQELNTVPFHLPAWDPRQATASSRGDDDAPALDGVLRFDSPFSLIRDLKRVPSSRWTTRTIPLRTVVPEAGHSGS